MKRVLLVIPFLTLVGCSNLSHQINELLRDDGDRAPNPAEVTLLPTPTPTPTPPCTDDHGSRPDCGKHGGDE